MGCTQAKQLLSPKPPVDLSSPAGLGHFDLQRVIGEGGFGKVKAVTFKRELPPKWYAMKVLNKETIVDRGRIKEVFRERDLLTFLRHERICNLYFSFQDDKHLYLVMDIALGGDLRYQLNHNVKGSPFSEDRTRIYTAQLVLALSYIHSKGVLHRDVKPENVLLNSEGWVMLTDFGISRDLDENGYCYSGSGTSGYMAPELYLKDRKHSKTADWFALGVTVHEFLTRSRPFRGDRIKSAAGLLKSNSKGPPLSGEDLELAKSDAMSLSRKKVEGVELSNPCLDFLICLFKVEPSERLGAGGPDEIIEHPWFQTSDSFNWDTIRDGTHSVPFVPNVKKMNAEPDADIHAVFMGDDEERNLRNLTAAEQKFFEDYEYDHRFAPEIKELPVRIFAESDLPRVRSARENSLRKFGSMSSHNSCSSLVGSKPTNPSTPNVFSTIRHNSALKGLDAVDIQMNSDFDDDYESVPSTKYTSALITTSVATDPDYEGHFNENSSSSDKAELQKSSSQRKQHPLSQKQEAVQNT